MEQELFLPTLMHWQYGNNWCGSLKRASFWITPKDEQLTAQQWLERQVAQATAAPRQESLRDRVTQEDEDSGISFGKVVLTVFLLMVIFGGDRRRRRGCAGCSGGRHLFHGRTTGLSVWAGFKHGRPAAPSSATGA